MKSFEIRDLATDLFLNALFKRYGYDFSHYTKASIRRRVEALALAENCEIGDLIPKILYEEDFLNNVLSRLSVPVTTMFRDPFVFKHLAEHIFPLLRTYPHFNVWQAGCATGEEVYSLAILLEENNLLNRVQIYATDINDAALQKAEDGIFSIKEFKTYEQNYREAGGKLSLKNYLTLNNDFFCIDENIRNKIVFAHHNLVTDGVFCEVHLILCRNVLIYFDDTLQYHVLKLFHQSLVRNGYLCLGTREHIQNTEDEPLFSIISKPVMLCRRLGYS